MDYEIQHFSNQIIELLNVQVGEYVMFYYGYSGTPLFRNGDTPMILLSKKKLDFLVSNVRELFPKAQVHTPIPGNGADILLDTSTGEQLQVHCIHRVLYRSLCLMDEVEINSSRVRHRSGIYMPSIAHLFEYAVLQCWMRRHGLTDRYIQFFEELHVLVQEDLLDYFNQKYGTSFMSLYELSEFQTLQYEMMLSVLKRDPTNGFMQNVRVKLFGARSSRSS